MGPYQAQGGWTWPPPWGQTEPQGAAKQRRDPSTSPGRTRHQSSGASSAASELLQDDQEYFSANEDSKHGRSNTPSFGDIRKINVDSFCHKASQNLRQ